MVFNATFNNILVILWQSALLVEETGTPGENHRPTIILYTLPWAGFELTTSVVIGTDFISSCKSNYHTITTTTAPNYWLYHCTNIFCDRFNLEQLKSENNFSLHVSCFDKKQSKIILIDIWYCIYHNFPSQSNVIGVAVSWQ